LVGGFPKSSGLDHRYRFFFFFFFLVFVFGSPVFCRVCVFLGHSPPTLVVLFFHRYLMFALLLCGGPLCATVPGGCSLVLSVSVLLRLLMGIRFPLCFLVEGFFFVCTKSVKAPSLYPVSSFMLFSIFIFFFFPLSDVHL